MRYLTTVLSLLSCHSLFSQQLPSDSLIQLKLFEKTGFTKTNYSNYEGDTVRQETAVYEIVFKDTFTLETQRMLLTILEARTFSQHGHQLGTRDFYFFNYHENEIVLSDSVKSDGQVPIGDVSEFKIVEIGKNKKGLVITFQSTGNRHFQKTESIYLIKKGILQYLLSVQAEYDNSAWKTPESKDENCDADRYTQTYEVIKSNKEFYDIRVRRTNYKFTNDCEDSSIDSETDKVYVYSNGKYLRPK